jgi:hypothetical protein
MREPDAEHEPAITRLLHGERLLRHRQRMAAVRRDDAGREFDARHLSGDDRQDTHRVEREDLRQSVGRKPVALGLAGVCDHVIDAAVGGVAAEQADLHCALLSPGRRLSVLLRPHERWLVY